MLLSTRPVTLARIIGIGLVAAGAIPLTIAKVMQLRVDVGGSDNEPVTRKEQIGKAVCVLLIVVGIALVLWSSFSSSRRSGSMEYDFRNEPHLALPLTGPYRASDTRLALRGQPSLPSLQQSDSNRSSGEVSGGISPSFEPSCSDQVESLKDDLEICSKKLRETKSKLKYYKEDIMNVVENAVMKVNKHIVETIADTDIDVDYDDDFDAEEEARVSEHRLAKDYDSDTDSSSDSDSSPSSSDSDDNNDTHWDESTQSWK